jgi:hypothetical protein
LHFYARVLQIIAMQRHFFVVVSTLFVLLAPALRAEDGDDWRDKFNDVYKMEEGEALKRIAPPFIPERKTYYLKEEREQAKLIAEPPTYFTFRWTGSSFQKWGYGFSDSAGMTIRGVLQQVLGLQAYEYQIRQDASAFRLKGDWMADATSEMETKLQKLCDIVRDAKGPSLRFTQKEIEQPVIVASGTYTFRVIEGTYETTSVHFFSDKPDKDEGSGGGSGDVNRFLTKLGDRAGMQVVDEVEEPRPKMISWRYNSSSNYKELAGLSDGAKKTEKLQKFLDNVSKQTSLKLTIEQRKVPVWVAEPAPK